MPIPNTAITTTNATSGSSTRTSTETWKPTTMCAGEMGVPFIAKNIGNHLNPPNTP